jgi:hypothetical protein
LEALHVRLKALKAVLDLEGYGPEPSPNIAWGSFVAVWQ